MQACAGARTGDGAISSPGAAGSRSPDVPTLLRASEWLRAPETFEYLDARNETRRIDLPAGSLAFTFVQVPVVYQRSDALRVQVRLVDGTVQECPGGLIPADLSAGIFGRTGAVERIEVRTPAAL